jgi:hypothetical protein
MTLHVLDQLPLWVEGDLSAADLAEVEGHLAECPTCHAAAERLRLSQAWLREALAPPFAASDEGALHRAVMAQIRVETTAKPIRRLAIRRGLLAACAASLLIATFIWRREPKGPVQLSGLGVPPAPMTVTPQPDARSNHAPHEAPRPAHPSPRMALARKAGSPPPAEPARIEFQTADPNIRIIWLARATPLPDTNPPLQEEP